MMNNKEFVDQAMMWATKKNTIYCKGMLLDLITEAKILEKSKQYPGWYTSAKISELRSLIGKKYYGTDCVCLIKSILWGAPNARICQSIIPDVDDDTLITLCDDVSTDFTYVEAGEILYFKGHVGIAGYSSDGIECTTNKFNKVTIQNMHDRSGSNEWTHHGKLNKYIKYSYDKRFQAQILLRQSIKKHLGLSGNISNEYLVKSVPQIKYEVPVMNSDIVGDVQKYFSNLGFNIECDNKFGKGSKAVVTEYQKFFIADGNEKLITGQMNVGGKTWKHMLL